jgi:hypothetical protein
MRANRVGDRPLLFGLGVADGFAGAGGTVVFKTGILAPLFSQ